MPLLSFSSLFAAFERIPQSPMQVGSGYTRLSTGPSAVDFLTQPASLVHVQGFGSTLFYGSPFRLGQLNQVSASVVFPSGFANFGVAVSSFGNTLYRETTFSLASGRRMGRNMDIGILVSGHELSIQNYGSDRTVGVTGSVNYHLSESLEWSLIYGNLNSPRLGEAGELLPQVVAMGFGFSPIPDLTATVEVERDLEFESRYKFGIRWRPLQSLGLATGFISRPAQITAGVSFQLKRQPLGPYGRISYAFATHPELDISQVFALYLSLP